MRRSVAFCVTEKLKLSVNFRYCPWTLQFSRSLFRTVGGTGIPLTTYQRRSYDRGCRDSSKGLFVIIKLDEYRRQFLLRIWPIQLIFPRRILFRSVLFSPIQSGTCSLLVVTFSDNFIFSILLQHHIWKLSKYFRSNFLRLLSLWVI